MMEITQATGSVGDRFDIRGCPRTMMAVVTTGNGGYEGIGFNARFWSSTENDNIRAWHRRLAYNITLVERRFGGKVGGLSVRCIKD